MHSACVILIIACVAFQTCSAEEQGQEKRFLTVSEASWGAWSSYSACSPSCPGGTKTKTRHCYEKGVQVPSEKCSNSVAMMFSTCTQSDCHQTATSAPCVDKISNCNRYSKSACQNPQYTAWAHGDCKHYCGFCTASAPCADKLANCYAYDKSVCTTYAAWAHQNCQKLCGYCTGSTAAPTAAPTVAHGTWSHWSSYSHCSVTCGTGTYYRTRTCYGAHAGHSCVGSSKQSYYCHLHSCPVPTTRPPVVNGHWAHWSSYSTCSHSCGSGLSTRHRACTSPAPSGGGHACPGSSYQTTVCHNTACVVNGAWGSWAHWSTCSTSCDMGTITRTRACNHPAPAHGGHTCAGSSNESHECSNGPCPTWTHWFEGTCSVSCGSGTRERLRHCSTGKDADCTGEAYQNVPCSNVQFPHRKCTVFIR